MNTLRNAIHKVPCLEGIFVDRNGNVGRLDGDKILNLEKDTTGAIEVKTNTGIPVRVNPSRVFSNTILNDKEFMEDKIWLPEPYNEYCVSKDGSVFHKDALDNAKGTPNGRISFSLKGRTAVLSKITIYLYAHIYMKLDVDLLDIQEYRLFYKEGKRASSETPRDFNFELEKENYYLKLSKLGRDVYPLLKDDKIVDRTQGIQKGKMVNLLTRSN